MRDCLKGQACKTFSQPSTMSSSDSESMYSDASVKSDVGSPVIQDLDIMVTDATVGSGDDETNAVGKTDSSSASASTAQILATNSSSARDNAFFSSSGAAESPRVCLVF